MEFSYLGKSGLQVSRLGFGIMTFFQQIAFDHGINFIDAAEGYGYGESEKMLGRVLKRLNIKRSKYVLTTKIYFGAPGATAGKNEIGLSRKHIIEGVKDALERMQVDHVDVVFAHRPDIHTPMEEIVRAFNWVIEKGWAFYWGTSEWSVEQIREAIETSKRLKLIEPIVEQCQYNILARGKVEKDLIHLYETNKLGLTTFAPVAGGVLTGKYANGIPEDSRFNNSFWEMIKSASLSGSRYGDWEIVNKKIQELDTVTKELNCTKAQLALAWVLKNPNVSVALVGASKVEQLKENLKCLDVVKKITPEIMEKIDNIMKNKPVPEYDWRVPMH